MKPKPWNVVSEKLHADCRIYQVYKQHCQHPDKEREGDFYVLKTNDWALVLALTPKEELVLVNQYRFGTGLLSLEIPGGVLAAGEDPVAGALRELQEETGFTGEKAHIIGRCRPNPAIMNNTAYFIYVTNCTRTHDVAWDPHEEIEICTQPLHSVFEAVRSGTIDHAITLNGLFFLQKRLTVKGP